MPRRVEDIVQNDRRSIRQVTSPKDEMRSRNTSKVEKVDEPSLGKGRNIPIHRLKLPDPPAAVTKKSRGKKRGGGKWIVAVILIIATVGGAGYVASAYFSRATFTIMPVIVPVSVNSTFVATGTSTPGYIQYTSAKFNDTATADVPATDGPYISTKSGGRVTIYNNYAVASQRLIAGTRLTTDSGLVYRLTGSITIPGYTVNSKGVRTPGYFTTAVTADAAGANYNISKAESGDLKIVSYSGSPKYETIYGRLATDMSGGFVGTKKTVSPALLASTTETLRSLLTARLLTAAKAAVPKGYVMYDSAYKTLFVPTSLSGTNAQSATVSVSGTLYSVLLRESDMASRLAGADKVTDFGTFAYSTPGLETLSFTITNASDFSPEKGGTLIAKVKGDMKLIGTVPVDTLKAKLKGLPLSETGKVLESYRSVIDITKSSGELFPSWASGVPSDLDRISIVVLTK